MHFSQGKKEITKKVYVNEQDKEDLLYLSSQDIDIYIKDYPGEKKYPITEKLLK